MKGSVTALVPAAGLGKRFSTEKNKPFHPLLGRPLIIWALEVLEGAEEVKEIIPILKEQDREQGIALFEKHGLTKIRRIAPGGKERQDSVYNGLKLLSGRETTVLIHDGARPLITREIVRQAVASLSHCDGVVTGVPVKDTIKEVSKGTVRKTAARDLLWAIQTPQVFRTELLLRAHELALEEKFYATDDAALVERINGIVKVVMGSYTNIKVTTPEDIPLAEALIRAVKGAGQ